METGEYKEGQDYLPIPDIIRTDPEDDQSPEWFNEEGEVRLRLPALEGTGPTGAHVFYGSFALMQWDEDNDDYLDPANMDAIPSTLGGKGEYMTYRENVAANKGRRRL